LETGINIGFQGYGAGREALESLRESYKQGLVNIEEQFNSISPEEVEKELQPAIDEWMAQNPQPLSMPDSETGTVDNSAYFE